LFRKIASFTDVWEAQKTLLSHIRPIEETVAVNVFDAAGRVLAKEIISEKNLPPRHASHMDGFAARSDDLKNASPSNPVRLRVVGESAPAKPPKFGIGPFEAARILTGGYLPEKADTVVPQEHVERDGEYIIVKQPFGKYEYVDVCGFDVKAGEVLFRKGHRLKMSDCLLLATLGVRAVEVLRKPRVGIMAVGDELTNDFDEAEKGKTLNTHPHLVKKLVEASGADATFIGIIPDSTENFQTAVDKNLGKYDVLISIAGSSISEKDVSSTVAERFEVFVHGLKLQPGRVGGFAVKKGKPLILLPGLVMSTLNVFMFLGLPVLKYLQHMKPIFYEWRRRARLADDIVYRKYHDFVKITWVKTVEEDDWLECVPVMGESSGMSIPSKADGFIIASPGVSYLRKGLETWVYHPPAL